MKTHPKGFGQFDLDAVLKLISPEERINFLKQAAQLLKEIEQSLASMKATEESK